MHTMKKQQRIGIIITIFAAVCWGFSGTCSEFLFKSRDISSEWLTMWRLIISGVFLLTLAVAKGKGQDLLAIMRHPQDRRRLIVFAIIGLMTCQYTYLAAISFSNSGTATILQYNSPVLIMIWACAIDKRLPRPSEAIAIVAVLIGVFLLATNGNISSLSLSNEALFWGLLSALALALYTVLPHRLLPRWGATIVTGWGMLIGGLFFAIVVHPFHQVVTWDAGTFFGLFGLIFIGTVMSFSLFLYGVGIIGPVRASMIAAIEPVSAALFSHYWIGTAFTFADILGFIAILFAVMILARH